MFLKQGVITQFRHLNLMSKIRTTGSFLDKCIVRAKIMGFSNGLYCCYGFLLRQKDNSFDIIISVLPWLRDVMIVV